MKMSFVVTGPLCAAAVSTAAIAAKPTTRNRAEIPAEYRWDFTAIYPSWAAWEEGMKEMGARMDAFAKLQGTLAQGPDVLLKAYQWFDEIGKLQYRLYRYPQLQRDVDTRDQAVSGRFQRVGAAFAKFATATAWFTPELLAQLTQSSALIGKSVQWTDASSGAAIDPATSSANIRYWPGGMLSIR